MTQHDNHGLATRLVHAGDPQNPRRSVAVPVVDSAAFVMENYAHHMQIEETLSTAPYYSRGYNPTVEALETKLAAIESAPAALAFNAGMAAISTTLLTLGRNGGHIIASDKVFSTSTRWLQENFSTFGGEVTFVNCNDLAEVEAAFRPNTRAVFFEEFTNPLLNVLDLEGLIALAHAHEALAVVDNTFASPALFRPYEFGADLVVHSATKYMSGHGRVLAGALSGHQALIVEIAELRRQMGTIITPHNAAGILQGLQTLDLRVGRASETAHRLALLAVDHEATADVYYPGLPGNVGHDIATRLTGGRYGGMLSFTLNDQSKKAAVYDAFELIIRATSLGDVASLVDSTDDPDVLRISVGIEDPDDLAADLEKALNAAL
ncbi:trans-sulfuration enzyme family protein [Streptomyces hawaiiensis]|uniref:trans-sulfuration enzyme family protein n=1 Tax=Streptomyces hawaiiensis TaxID=67305 RepID=UPI001586BB62|nr:aminotransferase class I/II-fold pyridoxal phosphate-dependent enzyme [Streptomyces hawaiiensis]